MHWTNLNQIRLKRAPLQMNTSSVLRNIQKQLSKGIVAKIKHKERSPGDQEES